MRDSCEIVKVFIGSPSDLDVERMLFPSILDIVNRSNAIFKGKRFEPVGWENKRPSPGRPQELINQDLLACEIVVLVLWKRWGTPTGEYSSGFDEEFSVAKANRKDILLYFRDIETESFADVGPQLRKVMDFRDKIEREREFLFQRYENPENWKDLLIVHLGEWLHGSPLDSGAVPEPSPPASPLIMPTIGASAPEKAGPDIQSLLATAGKLAREGSLTRAEETYAAALAQERSPSALFQFGSFLLRLGSLKEAEELFNELLTYGLRNNDETVISSAYSNIGVLLRTVGNLDEAEAMTLRSLDIEKKFQREEGMASNFGNLANIYNAKGDFKRAEEMYNSSLKIHRQLKDARGIAIQLGNLALVYGSTGALGQAKETLEEAIEINERIDDTESLASNYGNLSHIYIKQGDVEKAEALLRKSLDLNQRLGRKEGLACVYGDLGIVEKERNRFDQAEKWFLKSLELAKELGSLVLEANQHGNLGNIYSAKGDLPNARRAFTDALKIWEQLGHVSNIEQVNGSLNSLKEQ